MFAWDGVVNKVAKGLTKDSLSDVQMFIRLGEVLMQQIQSDIFRALVDEQAAKLAPGFSEDFDTFQQHNLLMVIKKMDQLGEEMGFSSGELSELRKLSASIEQEYKAFSTIKD